MGPPGLRLLFPLFFLLLLLLSTGRGLFHIPLPTGAIKIPGDVGPPSSLLPEICSLPPVHGPCLALHERWHFNWELGECATFPYGGCGGNLNNFVTRERCERACSPPGGPVRPDACPPPTTFPEKSCGQFCSSDDSCPSIQRCCGTECGQQCRLPVGASRGYCPRRSRPGHHPLLCLASCHRDADCALAFPGWKCCRDGCHGFCVAPVEEHPGVCPKMPVLQTFVPCNHTCADDRECPQERKCCFDGCRRACLVPVRRRLRCQLPPTWRTCLRLQPRYYYSPRHGRCRLFFYSSCEGNAYSFRSRSLCQRVCGGSWTGGPDPID